MMVFYGPSRQTERKVSGDLVFDDDGRINQSDTWLFEWEKCDPHSYARRAQRANITLGDLICGKRF